MIISNEHEFVFVHIPKCGGTSLRLLLAKYDSSGGNFTARVERHPVLGELDFVHLPLNILKEYFENEYLALCQYRSFSILRNPVERFPSSLEQWLKNTSKKHLLDLNEKEIVALAARKLEDLDKNPDPVTPSMIHFRKQVDYVFLDGIQVVKKLYRLESIEKEILKIESYLGVSLGEVGKANQSVRFRNKSVGDVVDCCRPMLNAVWDLLPISVKIKLHSLFFNADNLKVKGTEKTIIDVFFDAGLTEQILKYYSDDVDLYKSLAVCE